MNHRERLENAIAGRVVDQIPAVLWRHFPGDDQRTADFAQVIVGFQRRFEWDAVVIAPDSSYQAVDQGAATSWEGDLSGDRQVTRRVINRSLDWTELRSHDPQRGQTAKMLTVLGLVQEQLGEDAPPILMTVYSPLAQAARLAEPNLLRRHLRTRADRTRSGLNVLTENTLRYIEALKRAGVDGIRYVVEHANYDVLSAEEYATFGRPYDEKIIAELPDSWWLNILDILGDAPIFDMVKDFNVEAIRWKTQTGRPNIPQGKSLIRGAVCGGIPAWETMLMQTPSLVKETAREAIQAANGRRLILSTDANIAIVTPISNMHALRGATQAISGGSSR